MLALSLCLTLAHIGPITSHAGSQPYVSGHGINFATGNKYLVETDLSLGGSVQGFSFQRTYNSQSTESGVLGYGWSCLLTERLIDNTTSITLVQKDGRQVAFVDNGQGGYTTALGAAHTIARTTGGFTLTLANRDVHTYDRNGRLTGITFRNGTTLTYTYSGDQVSSITDSLGRSLSFTYESGRISQITTPAGTFSYGYDSNTNLTTVTRPDNSRITYQYATTGDVHNLTGVIDAAGVKIQSISYDDKDRVTHSELADGADAVSIGYPAAMTRTVTDALGVVSTYELEAVNGVVRVKSFTGPGCSTTCGDSAGTSYTYTGRQQIATRVDGNGVTTSYAYDSQGNQVSKTEAQDTPLARTTTTAYTAANQVASITEPSTSAGRSKVTRFTYDSRGNLLTRTVSGFAGDTAISAATTFTYDTLGRITSIKGPRAEVKKTFTLTYYPDTAAQGFNRGQLQTVTDPLRQTTTYSNYTALGKPGTIVDPTGLTTAYTYDFMGKVLSRTVGGLTTGYSYDPAGRLTQINLPSGGTLSYTYSGDKVSSIVDSLGNTITFGYDAKGQQTEVEMLDPGHRLMYALNQAYDQNGNLSKRIYPGGAEASYEYDAVHNLTAVIDPVHIQTTNSFDVLNRLTEVSESGIQKTSYSYDRQGNVSGVSDARGNTTTTTTDDLGRVMEVDSPDSGTTSFTYDGAGNVLTQTNAKNQTIATSYDEVDRPVQQSYPNIAQTIKLTYDNKTGRLSGIQEEYSSRSFVYNNRGQVTAETRQVLSPSKLLGNLMKPVPKVAGGNVTATVGYGYDATTGELVSLTYPSGRIVSYIRNTMGQITSIRLDGQPLATNINFLPFGPMQSATLGSLDLVRAFDQRYQVSRIQAGSLDLQYTRDAAGRVSAVVNQPIPATGSSMSATVSPDSNRLQTLNDGQVWNFVHDANGNVISEGGFSYTWDALNRLVQVRQGNTVLASYAYDTQNRRIAKIVGDQAIHFVYDLNNNLIAETTADGTPIRDYFYLNNEPLAVREYQNNPGLYYFINDHLGTPQQLVNASGAVVWQAAYLPYGEAQVQAGNAITNNLRFPGQYFDAETGLHYNWNRYYDPGTGRYLSADPIGLDGGLNLYAYVDGNPVNRFDLEGLASFDFKAGTHIPIRPYPLSFGASAGPGGGGPEVVIGSYWDFGFSIGVKDLSDTCGAQSGNTINFGLGRYLGLQINERKNAVWYNPLTWLDGISVGLGLGLSTPITYTVPYKDYDNK